jgi:hypothetical protein
MTRMSAASVDDELGDPVMALAASRSLPRLSSCRTPGA